ncbi:unnamed protein product, partial [Choristocarpus tenellus]
LKEWRSRVVSGEVVELNKDEEKILRWSFEQADSLRAVNAELR